MKRYATVFAAILILVVFFVSSIQVLAQSSNTPILKGDSGTAKGLGSGDVQFEFTKCIQSGDCGAEHIFILANNIIKWMVGVSGALALLMYIIGGVWMIFSGGLQSRIERGKDILIGTSVALVFILGSWVIINFVLTSLGTDSEFQLKVRECDNQRSCTGGKVCYNNRCVEACEAIVKANDSAHDWSCRTPESCGVTYDQCNASGNCKTGYCSGGQDNVCCYPRK